MVILVFVGLLYNLLRVENSKAFFIQTLVKALIYSIMPCFQLCRVVDFNGAES